MSGNPQDNSNGSGITTPGAPATSPAMPGKLLTGKPVTFLLIDFGSFTLKTVEFTLNWLSENCSHFLWPSIKGLSWTLASWTLLYLDSNKPGVNPPASLSPSRTGFGMGNRTTSHHIGYLTSLAIGVVIFSLNLSNE